MWRDGEKKKKRKKRKRKKKRKTKQKKKKKRKLATFSFSLVISATAWLSRISLSRARQSSAFLLSLISFYRQQSFFLLSFISFFVCHVLFLSSLLFVFEKFCFVLFSNFLLTSLFVSLFFCFSFSFLFFSLFFVFFFLFALIESHTHSFISRWFVCTLFQGKTTNNKQRTTNNKQQTERNKQHTLISSRIRSLFSLSAFWSHSIIRLATHSFLFSFVPFSFLLFFISRWFVCTLFQEFTSIHTRSSGFNT